MILLPGGLLIWQ